MPKYKLTYFNARERAEITRYMFAIAGLEYEDNRVEHVNWPELKKTMPFCQLPILEVDGVMISQTSAIARLVAKRLGLAGKDDIEQALADSIVVAVDDMFTAMVNIYLEKDEEKKTELQKKLRDESAPDTLSKLEAILSGNSSGYFVGHGLTWADVIVFDMLGWIRGRPLPDAYFSKYPKILALESKIKAMPNIASWLAKRPETIF